MTKLDCPRVEELSAYVDDALEPDALAALAVHLGACADCRKTVHGFRELHTALRDLAGARVGQDLAPRLQVALAGSGARVLRRPARLWRVLPLPLAAAASLLLGVFLGGLLVHIPAAAPVSPAMAVFDVVPPGGICMSAGPCSPQGRIY